MTAGIDQVEALVHGKSGVKMKPSQRHALRAALGRIVPGGEPEDFLSLAEDPVAGSEAVAGLLDEVTVQETSFLRDRRQLEAISWPLLLEGARFGGAPVIRVWSAGCATGEEAYTLALLACEAFAPAPPPVTIFATDISRAAIEQARQGRYGRRSARELDAELCERYFVEDGDRFVVGDRLRRLVTFRHHNLVHDPMPPLGEIPFHLVLCRNVLIYFDGETAKRVVGLLDGAVDPSGMLLLGAADALCVTDFDQGGQLRGRGKARAAAQGLLKVPLRRPLGLAPVDRGSRIERSLRAAHEGQPGDALEQASRLIAEDPLNAHGHFLLGLVELERGEPAAAVKSLRRALYIFPNFALAAFTLGRAYDTLGDRSAARRAYEQSLRTIEPAADHDDVFLEQIDLGDVAVACRARIQSLR